MIMFCRLVNAVYLLYIYFRFAQLSGLYLRCWSGIAAIQPYRPALKENIRCNTKMTNYVLKTAVKCYFYQLIGNLIKNSLYFSWHLNVASYNPVSIHIIKLESICCRKSVDWLCALLQAMFLLYQITQITKIYDNNQYDPS